MEWDTYGIGKKLELRARQLCVRRGDASILRNVDFVARGGSMVGVLGPSGSGKTTLLYALSGFRPATSGGVLLDKVDLYKNFSSRKRDIGFVPQDDIVPTALRVERVLKYSAELRLPELPARERDARVGQILTTLGLSERRRVRVSNLSGGQRKRVSIAVELLSQPSILFADEPTSGLDPALEASLMQQLKKMCLDGRIVVLTTHIMSSLELLDAVCVIVKGYLAYFGPPERLKDYFEVDDFTKVYTQLEKQSGERWYRRFCQSDLHRGFL